MKILILGATGFIGRNLKEFFEKNSEYELFYPSRQQLDLLDEGSVDAYLKKVQPDVVINAAVCRNPKYFSNTQPLSELEQDLRMFHILEKRQDLYGKLIYFGSGAEYGKQNPIVSVKEEDLTGDLPLTQYGMAKYTIGRIIESSRNIYNLRIFGLFGKYENWRTTFISGACCKALYKLPITIRQNVVFDYLYINDFCKIVNKLINSNPKEHTYNICSGKRVELVELAKIIIKISGSDLPIYVCSSGYGNEYTGSNERLANEFGETDITSFDVSINELYSYYASIINDIDMLSLLYQ